MPAPSGLTRKIHDRLSAIVAQGPDAAGLEKALRLLAMWRATVLENTHRTRDGLVVAAGPFAGMTMPVAATEGAGLPRRLGCYEASLSPAIEALIARAPALVLDIGCAEGYYAVGLARRLPGTRVCAHDTNPAAREACAALAAANAVSARVSVGGEVTAADLAICGQMRTAIICDIEGAEDGLLDPARAPALAGADILVECHDCWHPGLSDRLAARFDASHRVSRLDRSVDPAALPGWAAELSDLDRLLMLWEWRQGPTPWLWMEARRS